MMLENLEKVQSATQSYMDTVEKTMRGFPGANDGQISDLEPGFTRQACGPKGAGCAA
jgi:hypothetical protein